MKKNLYSRILTLFLSVAILFQSIMVTGLPVVAYAEESIITVPKDLTAVDVTDTKVKLAWNMEAGVPGTITYSLYRDGILIASNIQGTSYEVTGLTAGASYRFTVKAKNEEGLESEESLPVNVITDTIISSDLTLYEDKTFGDLYLNGGTLNVNGKKLTVQGNLIQYSGTLYVNAGQVDIGGDYRLQREVIASNGTKSYERSFGYLRMINATDYVKVDGDFITHSDKYHSGYLTNGILEVKGNFQQKYYSGNSDSNYNFYATGYNAPTCQDNFLAFLS